MKKNISFRKLRIAIFCTNEFSIPPSPKMKDIYSPLWLLHYLTEELVKKGHEVTLFASSDSTTKARLISENLISLASNKNFSQFYKQVTKLRRLHFYEQMAARKTPIEHYEYLLLTKLVRMALEKKFDLVYISLIGLRALPLVALCNTPTVCTIHDPITPLTILLLKEYKKRFSHIHFLGLTKSQIKPAPWLFSGFVYNGIKIENFNFNPKRGDYLLVSGRIDPRKGTYEAIKIAKRLKEKLIIIGRHTNDNYWHKKIKPLLTGNIKYKGLLYYKKVPKFYENAKALLAPICWEEPCPLAYFESMACGTPVIVFNRGSAKELVKDGKTGFVVDPFDKNGRLNLKGFIEAIKKIDQIDRGECRKWVEEKFTVEKMVDNYEKIFCEILERTRK